MSDVTKHTQSDWLIGRGADGLPIIYTAPDSFSPSGQGIAHVCKRPMTQEQTANALLLAAAPKMLAVLKRIVMDREDDPSKGNGSIAGEIDYRDLRDAIAAIAKATGAA